MELGVSASQKPIEEALFIAKMAKIFNIELDLSLQSASLESFTNERINNILNLAGKYGASITIRLPGSINLSEQLEIVKRSILLYAVDCIMLAKKLGAKIISLPLGYYNHTEDKNAALNRAINTVKTIAVFARKEKICIAVENAKYLSKDSEFSYLGDNLKDIERVFNTIKSPYVKFCLDTGRANTNEGPVKYIKRLKERLVLIRYSDNYGRKDEMIGVGEGTINWKELANVLRKENFNGPLISNIITRSVSESKRDIMKYFKD